MYKILSYVFAAVIALTSAIGLPIYKEETGLSTTAAQVSDASGTVSLEFEKQRVNTVEIELEGEAECEITVYNNDEVIYSRASSDAYRFCAFPTVETDKLTVKISNGTAKSVKASFKQSENGDFRVTSYVVADRIQSASDLNPKAFDVITDAILFGCVTFDENAQMTVNTPILETALANLRNAIGDRNVNVYVNILGPGSDGGISDWNAQMANQAEKHSKAFATRRLEGQIAELLEKYNLDGIFFDYEYPIEKKSWSDFSRFLVRLNKTTDKKIGIAVAHWDLGLSYAAIRAVDMVELMQYDLFDAQGNHSSFTTAVDGFEAARDYLLPRDKADIGIPFYARPASGAAYWPSYADYAEALGKNTDYTETEYGKAYFNSWQTVYDKTAYTMSRGLGGMMVWHYSCDVYDTDSSLSLFGAMKDCINDRTV